MNFKELVEEMMSVGGLPSTQTQTQPTQTQTQPTQTQTQPTQQTNVLDTKLEVFLQKAKLPNTPHNNILLNIKEIFALGEVQKKQNIIAKAIDFFSKRKWRQNSLFKFIMFALRPVAAVGRAIKTLADKL